MKKILKIAFIVCIVLVVLNAVDTKNKKEAQSPTQVTEEKQVMPKTPNVIMGSAFTPRNFPGSSLDDVNDYFEKADVLGSHVGLISEWEQGIDIKNVQTVRDMARAKGMQFHFTISPVALTLGRNKPAIPDSAGGESFTDLLVRQAYIEYVLTFAALKPDVLGLGTEVNYLSVNEKEYDAYVSLVKEAYDAVKAKYPNQTLTISFQWDELQKQDIAKILNDFKGSVDIYSFTTYPSFVFKTPADMPEDYYTKIRTYLPNERIGFSEVGWHTKGSGSEDEQKEYYGKLKELMGSTRPEYVTLGLLHDVKIFGGLLGDLNSVGVRNRDGSPKQSWDSVVNLGF